MKITVITVCYNAAKGLEKTIESVISQSYPNIEYIIIDGGSHDNTIDIIERYKNNIDYFVSEPDKGIYDAMNKGILKSHGDLINFMNAGDVYYSKDSIKEIVSLYQGEDILYGNIYKLYGKQKVLAKGIISSKPNVIDFMGSTFHHQASFINRTLFDKIGLYSLEYKLASDWKFFFDATILNGANIKHVDKTIAIFEMGGASSNIYYAEEKMRYLRDVYGNDLFEIFQELQYYRSTWLCRQIFTIKYSIKKLCSPVMLKKYRRIKSRVLSLFGMTN